MRIAITSKFELEAGNSVRESGGCLEFDISTCDVPVVLKDIQNVFVVVAIVVVAIITPPGRSNNSNNTFLSKCIDPGVYKRSKAPDPPSHRPLSPITFAGLLAGGNGKGVEGDEGEEREGKEADTEKRGKRSEDGLLGGTSIPSSLPSSYPSSSSPPPTVTPAATNTPISPFHYSRFTLLSFSTTRILQDEYTLAWYGLQPYEFLEMHPVSGIVKVDRGIVAKYVEPYFEERVRTVRVVWKKVKDPVHTHSSLVASFVNTLSSFHLMGDVGRPTKGRRINSIILLQWTNEIKTRFSTVFRSFAYDPSAEFTFFTDKEEHICGSFGDLTPTFLTSCIVFVPPSACFDFFQPFHPCSESIDLLLWINLETFLYNFFRINRDYSVVLYYFVDVDDNCHIKALCSDDQFESVDSE
ncbi:hypothetical protein JAAARDRAFT_200950 [Jaapia argillacea MUCL 33604]|uniref:Uncharacterized protein n=1 Tax=Jaapia argillacea MUCL 33604 TaxID=933084 RepID=A0A067P3F4_9AGAM|nr:hypothetical protein JAAARDRAFT_200950 [Jaapia argillacea MUCL 33604]